jgi:hypothetical protein
VKPLSPEIVVATCITDPVFFKELRELRVG